MDALYQELAAGLPDGAETVRIVVRVMASVILAAILGFQRERTGKPAGLRTHMLVALSSTLFVLAPLEIGMDVADMSRVIQGVATGIGFLGAGAILKMETRAQITGLTTAAGIWMTAAIGIAAGLGRYGLAALSVVLGWAILTVLTHFERRVTGPSKHRTPASSRSREGDEP